MVRRERLRIIVPIVETDPFDLVAAVLAGRWSGVPVRPVVLREYSSIWPSARREFGARLEALLLSHVDRLADLPVPTPLNGASTPSTEQFRP